MLPRRSSITVLTLHRVLYTSWEVWLVCSICRACEPAQNCAEGGGPALRDQVQLLWVNIKMDDVG